MINSNSVSGAGVKVVVFPLPFLVSLRLYKKRIEDRQLQLAKLVKSIQEDGLHTPLSLPNRKETILRNEKKEDK